MNAEELNKFLSKCKGNVHRNYQQRKLKDSYNTRKISNETLGSHFPRKQQLIKTISDTLRQTPRRNISRNLSKNKLASSDEKFIIGSKTQRGFYNI
jgi:hypothetical protein